MKDRPSERSSLAVPPSTLELTKLLRERELTLASDGSKLLRDGHVVAVRAAGSSGPFRDVNQVVPKDCRMECIELFCYDEDQLFGPPRKICICVRWGCI
jgi:hypothetical protein